MTMGCFHLYPTSWLIWVGWLCQGLQHDLEEGLYLHANVTSNVKLFSVCLHGMSVRESVYFEPNIQYISTLLLTCYQNSQVSYLLHGTHNTSYQDKIRKGSKTKLDACMQRKNYIISAYNFLNHN